MPLNVLIVDDSSITRAVVKRTLSVAGLPLGQCLEAENGQAALRVLASAQVDLVLTDLHMPEMGGEELATRILDSDALRHIPILVISAEPNADRLDQLIKKGVRGVVPKPFTPEAIRTEIVRALGVSHG